MVNINDIGKTTKTLNTSLGQTTPDVTSDDITLIAGEIRLGLLLFDPDGTLGVISSYTDVNNFTITTYALSINIERILGLSY